MGVYSAGVTLLCVLSCASGSVVTSQVQLSYNYVHTLELDSSIEYVVQFPEANRSQTPALVWVQCFNGDCGDSDQPVLVTARQKAGSVTWQLPYETNGRKLYELERTLCPDNVDRCDSNDGTNFTLHVSSASAVSFTLLLRVASSYTWDLNNGQSIDVVARQTSPSVMRYHFQEGQDSVRLVLSSDSDLCAVTFLQNYKCPIVQKLEDIPCGDGYIMTRSSKFHITRDEFSCGFYIVLMVMESAAVCGELALESEATGNVYQNDVLLTKEKQFTEETAG